MRGGFRRVRSTGRYVQTVRLTNNGGKWTGSKAFLERISQIVVKSNFGGSATAAVQ